jgi:hypothetical protein
MEYHGVTSLGLLNLTLVYGGHPIYLYFYDPIQIINFNSLNMQVCHIILSHVIFIY